MGDVADMMDPVPDVPDSDDHDIEVLKKYGAGEFLIGLLIALGASVMNALGLNITKLDHSRQEALPPRERAATWIRPLAILGMALYVVSQLVGSTLALEYLRAEWVAPLGSTSLIFNFLFAHLLVGTRIVRRDIYGTCVIVVGVIGTVLFSQMRKGGTVDKESNLSLETLKDLWRRAGWIIYLIFLECVTIGLFLLSRISEQVLFERDQIEEEPESELPHGTAHRRLLEQQARERQRGIWSKIVNFASATRLWTKGRLEEWSMRVDDNAMKKLTGTLWGCCGGLLAGQSLVFAKSAVKLVAVTLDKSAGNQFASPVSIIVLILLAVTAVVQVYCLNKGLEVFDSTIVVPIFYALYTCSGFVNSLIYLNETKIYKPWVFALIWLSIGILVAGVGVLSSKKTERPSPKTVFNVPDEEDDPGKVDETTLTAPQEGNSSYPMKIFNFVGSKLGTSSPKTDSGSPVAKDSLLRDDRTRDMERDPEPGMDDDDDDSIRGQFTLGESKDDLNDDSDDANSLAKSPTTSSSLVRPRRIAPDGDGSGTPVYTTMPKPSASQVEFGDFASGS